MVTIPEVTWRCFVMRVNDVNRPGTGVGWANRDVNLWQLLLCCYAQWAAGLGVGQAGRQIPGV